MKKPNVQLKVIDKILPYKMQFEKCWDCGSEAFFVVFTNFKSMPREGPEKKVSFPFDLPTDVEFFCSKCGEASSGIFFNEDLVDMKSRTKKLKLEDLPT